MREMIDWIGAEAERVEDSVVFRRRGRFTHEEVPELTTEGTEGTEEIKIRRLRIRIRWRRLRFRSCLGRRNGRGGFIGRGR
jgi:hypothetical protein